MLMFNPTTKTIMYLPTGNGGGSFHTGILWLDITLSLIVLCLTISMIVLIHKMTDGELWIMECILIILFTLLCGLIIMSSLIPYFGGV